MEKAKQDSSKSLAEIIKLVPNYDPYATAGDCVFIEEKGQHSIDFIQECCVHMKGELADQKIMLEDWQKAAIGNIFGWYRPDGTRRYREVLLYIPRKNSKTTMCACIGNYIFFCDEEPGAEVYCAAAEKEQASIVWKISKYQVEHEQEMMSRCKIYPGYKTIESLDSASFYRPISAEANTKHGFNAHAVLFDELHVQKNNLLIEALETSVVSRREPIIIYMTTADFAGPSICNEKFDYAKKVCDGTINDSSLLPIIYEADKDDDWRDEKTWRKANPNYGISVKDEYIRSAAKKAEEASSRLNSFLRLHLNIQTDADIAWIMMDQWDACIGDLDPEELKGQECYAGIDLASTSDLNAFAMFFPDYNALLMKFWIPKDTARKRHETNRVDYLTWGREGHMILTDGNVADYDVIRADVVKAGEIYDIKEIAIDRWNSTHLQTQLGGDGFDIVPFGQGYASMSAPAKEFEKLVVSGKLIHFGHPVLKWNAANVMIEFDSAENIKPSKKKSTEKIDGVVAAVMAIGRSMAVEGDSRSVYEERGLITL